MIWNKLKRKLAAKLNVPEKEFLPAILEITDTPPSPVGRLVLWAFFIAICGTLLWTVFGHVDEVATAPGKMIPIGNVKVLQAGDKGVVKNIFIKEGQRVNKGDLLIELDQTISAADVAGFKKQIAYYNLEISRLMAQKTGAPFQPGADPDLDPKDLAAQVGLYQSWLLERQARVVTAQAAVQQSAAALETARVNQVRYSQQLEIAREIESRLDGLYAQNAVAYFQLLGQRAKRMELEQALLAQESEIAKNEALLMQSQGSLANVQASYDKDIDTRLTDDRKQLLQYTEELKKADERNRLARITAPIDGRIGELAVHTIGGVVTAAQVLMTIVPDDATLQMEAWVANKDIGFVHEGQAAEVKIETFNFQKFGTIPAVVENVSPDATEDKEKGRTYRVLLKLDKDKVLVNDKFVDLTTGMSATADIKIRQKRIIEYFLDPFKQYQNEALRER
jgi:hemolysin D